MGFSSVGIGSGLKVQDMVDSLVALERKPLAQLQVKAASLNARVSAFGQLKSQIANLQDQASKLAQASTWGAMAFTSSNAAAVSGVASEGAAATGFSVEVQQLASAQSAGSAVFAAASPVGTGTLKIQLGSWSKGDFSKDDDGAAEFVPGAGAEVGIDITAADDTLAKVAAKINAAKAGVTATVLRDASGERLLMRSSETGVAQGFRIQATEGGAAPGLARLGFDPQGSPAAAALALTQTAQDTLATINGVQVASKNNTLTNAVEGLTLTVAQVTTAPVDVSVKSDTAGARTAIKNFVESYNALNNALGSMTAYDQKTKTAGTLQGDSTAVNLQSALRRLVGGMGAGGEGFVRLSDVGVQFQADGTLKIDDAKLGKALERPEALKNFFVADPEGTDADGMAVRIKEFAGGLLGADGTFATKTKSLETSVKRNADDQQKVNDRAARTEARLLAQYTRLDAAMGKLDALNSYVAQQVTQWNKTTS